MHRLGNWPAGPGRSVVSALFKRRAETLKRCAALAVAAFSLAGCAQQWIRRQGPESAPIIRGPAITDNTTLLEPVYACYRDALMARGPNGVSDRSPISVSVGEVRDYTGKSSINEGAALTQGGTLMVMSALGRLAPAVRIHERFDPRVGELELIYADRRQLGDGRAYAVPGPGPGQSQRVPWMPYAGGTIMNSRYFIVGGITELNWNVQSGGVDVRLNNAGPAARTFTASIAADLRIVDTRSLVVLRTVSLQKQVVGHEVELNVFRFFGSRLFDITAGTRNQEPIQLAVRATLEIGVLELMASVSGVSFQGCAEPAIRAGMLSARYNLDADRTVEPAPRPPFVPQPLPIPGEAQMAPAPAAPPAQERGALPQRAAIRPAEVTSQPRANRPDAEMRPSIPAFLQGPQLLPPPGSLSLQPSGAATPPSAPTAAPDIFPDPQRRSDQAPAAPQAPRDTSSDLPRAPAALDRIQGTAPVPPTPLGSADEPVPQPPRRIRTLGQRQLENFRMAQREPAARDGG